MRFDRNLVSALAIASGFRPETLEKVLRLGRLVADVARHPLLSHVLALKGGTALNLFFGSPRRLSVDLDFNYVGNLNRDRMLAERPEVERALETIAGSQEYGVQRSAEEHGGRKLYLAYANVGGSRDRVEVDINYLFRQPLLSPALMSMWQPGDIERPATTVLAFEELAAGKLCAFLDRAAPRDLYDVAHLPGLDENLWNSVGMRRLFIAMAGVLPRPIHTYREERLDRVTDTVVREELIPMLSRDDTIGAGELRERSWGVVRPFLDLNDAEQEYTDRIQRGELRPELLFPDDTEMIGKLGQHPALLWKTENARRHWERRGS